MAKETPKTTAQLEAEYQSLLKKCSAFDPATKEQLRRHEEALKAWKTQRIVDRKKLLDAKGAAYQAWQASLAAEADANTERLRLAKVAQNDAAAKSKTAKPAPAETPAAEKPETPEKPATAPEPAKA
jgi:hypothetical protein